ncbi:hypothetical protein Nmel_011552 [Mimus melanotis]
MELTCVLSGLSVFLKERDQDDQVAYVAGIPALWKWDQLTRSGTSSQRGTTGSYRIGLPAGVLYIWLRACLETDPLSMIVIVLHLPPWSWHCSEEKLCCGVEPFLRCFVFPSSQLEAAHSNLQSTDR